MNVETIKQILEESRADIKAAAVEALKAKVAQDIGWRLNDELGAVIRDFIAKEIAPEVAKMLADDKAGILAHVEQAVAVIGAEMAKKMMATATESLNGYKGREVVAALMGGR